MNLRKSRVYILGGLHTWLFFFYFPLVQVVFTTTLSGLKVWEEPNANDLWQELYIWKAELWQIWTVETQKKWRCRRPHHEQLTTMDLNRQGGVINQIRNSCRWLKLKHAGTEREWKTWKLRKLTLKRANFLKLLVFESSSLSWVCSVSSCNGVLLHFRVSLKI